MESNTAATLSEAIASQPPLLQGWVTILVLVHLIAIVFFVRRTGEGWRVQYEPIAIFASFFAGAGLMEWLFGQYGYVRLLGLAHLVFWAPVYAWVLTRQRSIGTRSVFGKYIIIYLIIAGTSLAIDVVDVIRYFVE